MIEQIKIKNFQSHKSTQLKLDPGVNVIVGRSDSGKTSIMRALFWVIENRPLGNAFCSHWALNIKGKQEEHTAVTVFTNGKKVKRLRTVDENSYKIGEKLLGAIGTDVPEEVKQAFNLTEVNIQKQMDSPFLLSESAGEVARFFNRIIRLDIIDSFLSAVDSKKRESKAQRIANESEVDRIGKELKTLDWIDKADRLILKAEQVEDKIEKTKAHWHKLVDKIYQCEILQTELLSVPDIDKAGELLEEWSKLDFSKHKLSLLLSDITVSIGRWTESFKQSEEELPDLRKAQNLISKYEELLPKQYTLADTIDELVNTIHKHEKLEQRIMSTSDEIIRLENQLPERCPTCGQLLKGK